MVLYTIVVMVVATVLSRRGTLIVAGACIGATIVGYAVGHVEEESLSAIGRSAVACFSIAATTALMLRIQADSTRLEQQIRELNQAHEALNRSTVELAHATRVAELGELAASIAHEVNQPLAAIATQGEAGVRWLRRDTPDLKEGCNALEAMVSNARRASDVIRRIRALASKREPAFDSLDVNNVVVDTIDLLGWEIEKYGAVAQTRLAPGKLTVDGDRIQLQQVLINLIVNGLQAMATIHDRPRVLRVNTRIENDGRAVVVAVEDSGVGIAPEVASNLFCAFFTTKADGMGLGLSICRSIIEGHGGSISCAASASPGALIQIELPAAAAAAAAGANHSVSESVPTPAWADITPPADR
jgi:C4-dicarboxylate-specific signal transduction histidine kinase